MPFKLSGIEDEILRSVSASAAKLNMQAYAVGGWVRDRLLGREVDEIDFVTVGDGIEFANQVAKDLGYKGKIAIYKNFGTAQFNHKGWNLEFVGARKESYSEDSRNPEVSPGTLKEDQERRDFTVNALAFNLNGDKFGELVDPFNGKADMEARIIKTPLDPDTTFSDDPLRMFRAIRFACQLDFEIDEEVFASIKRNLYRVDILAQERITAELNKMIEADPPSRGFFLMDEAGILAKIFPEFVALKGVDRVGNMAHKDNFLHTLEVLDNVGYRSPDLWLRWAAILHDIAKPKTKKFDKVQGWTFHAHEFVGYKMVKGIFRRFKLPMNEKMKFVEKLVLLHLRPISLTKENITDSAIRRLLFEAGDDIDDLMLLCEADITTKSDAKKKRYTENLKLVRQKLIDIEEKDRVRNFQPPVSGEQIMEAFGLKPCREVGMIKNAIKDAILDGELKNEPEAAYQFMLAKGKELGLDVKV